MNEMLDQDWKKVVAFVTQMQGVEPDMEGILFLVGVQELGQGHRKFNKNQKLDVLHIAICTLLEPYGYYAYEGQDADGWPHWKVNENLPPLKPAQQHLLMREALVEYFKRNELI